MNPQLSKIVEQLFHGAAQKANAPVIHLKHEHPEPVTVVDDDEQDSDYRGADCD